MNQPIIIVGHSHRNALGVPRDNHDEAHELRPLEPEDERFEAIAGLVNRDYWDKLSTVAPGRDVGIIWDGNQHNGHFLLKPDVPFDLVVSELPHLPLVTGWPIVPELAVREKFQASAHRLRETLEQLVENRPRRIALISAPPPKKDEKLLRPLLKLERYFAHHAEVIGVSLDDIEITPASVRLKLWKAEQNALYSVANDFGCAYVNVPSQACDEEGYLKYEFWADDATHANRAYGLLMKNDIVATTHKSTFREHHQ